MIGIGSRNRVDYEIKYIKTMNIKNKANFKNIHQVIARLNSSTVAYAILRNYDNLLEDELYMEGHGDIDLICEDSRKLAPDIGALDHPGHVRNGEGNGTHYIIYINGVEVSLDLRHIGDAYYCEQWERDMLLRRKLHNGFYVLSKEDYFYTLIYHAIFQKDTFSEDYQRRLKKMGEDLGVEIKNNSISFYVNLLEKHMKQHDYHYEYPVDKYVPLKRKYIQDTSLLKFHFSRYIEHVRFETKVKLIEVMVKMKHKILNRG